MSVSSLANKVYAFQREVTTQDAIGGEVKTWGNHLRLPGRIQPLSSRDAILHSKDESTVTHKGYFGGTPDILAGDRIAVGSRILMVRGVRNIDYADEFVTLELEEMDQ